MHGAVVGVYTPAQLAGMSPEEVHAVIVRDLHEDAFERQRRDPVAYKGKNLAERIETALYICPVCRAVGALRSHGDSLRCGACGTEAVYTVYGFLEGGFGFDNALDWDRWQTAELRARLGALAPDETAFSDDGFILSRIGTGHLSFPVDEGILSASRQTLRCGGTVFALADITEMSMFGRVSLVFTAGGEHYELRPAEVKCARKYLELYKLLQE